LEKTVIERSALLQEIETLPPRYYGEVLDFVGYIKEKKLKENLSLKKAAEAAAEKKQLTMAQIKEWAKAPEIQSLVGALNGMGLPADISIRDIQKQRVAEKYSV
jgi:hypothetical protein